MGHNLLTAPIVLKPRGATLRGLRESKKKTLQEVSIDIQIPVLRISLYERGNSIPIEHVEIFSEYYNFPVTELVDSSSLSEVILKIDNACRILNHFPQV